MSDGATPFGLSVDTVDGDGLSDVLGVADAARDDDGVDPFNEQTRLDLASGRRVGHVGTAGGVPVAAAATGAGQLDLVVLPAKRGNGYGSGMLDSLLPALERDASAWSHGDHPAARALAASHGFDRVRVLLRLRLDELPAGDDAGAGEAVGTGPATDGIQFESFDAERDAADWLALNARAFASHPEQGGMTADDLRERMDEDWFDPHDFLVARDATGLMLGFHWMKLEPDSDDAEVYVLGVAPDASGRGLGRRLLAAGLRHMRERGRTSSSLFVEGDNRPALALYRSVGFVDDAVDVQYRRLRVGS